MLRYLFLAIIFLTTPQTLLAGVDEDGYNEYTIRPSDIPKDAPRFEEYPAKPFCGPNAAPDLRSHPRSRMYRTSLKLWAREKPNFAGHFILANWGCGTDCTALAIIDARSGKIHHPTGLTFNVAVNVHHDLLNPAANLIDAWHGTRAISCRVESRLLIVIGMPEEKVVEREIHYYVWEGDHLKRVRFVKKPWYPEARTGK
jgi:hypothetical protein